MNGLAALAAKEAVVATGLGTSLLPGIAPSAVDGFAVGTLLSGVCFLLVMVPRRGWRRPRQSAADTVLTEPEAAPGYDGYAGYATAASLSGVLSDESAEIVVSPPPLRDEVPQEPKGGGYRSKHRLADPVGDRRTETRRAPGRHAAPSARSGARTARLGVRALAVRS
ncbi:MAG TPA: hypothetical protein VMR00_17095 [Streptosporangiaceae bacterium]|jgi:hypothetical protein|nr:hypothetical protein [Streptosporangiaceae bacterium]